MEMILSYRSTKTTLKFTEIYMAIYGFLKSISVSISGILIIVPVLVLVAVLYLPAYLVLAFAINIATKSYIKLKRAKITPKSYKA
jgi:hypothetical protein